MIQFLLNDKPHVVDEAAPSLSVLQYLRTRLVQTGTKEGCAAGDCGACTVVLGRLENNEIIYHAVNACITPLATLHGKQLITVEHLRDGINLHPVQEAMIECHGSQCGFCTPGIVMSLFAWWDVAKDDSSLANRHSVETALSGNLCRCTGYQPILRAAEKSLHYSATTTTLENSSTATSTATVTANMNSVSDKKQSLIDQLNAIAQGAPGELVSSAGRFYLPVSSQQLAELLSTYPSAQLIAGATDLGLDFTQQLKQPDILIYTGNVAEMQLCEETATTLRLGGALSYQRMQPALRKSFPPFSKLLDRLGSLQIRNQGTLGGNVANASPIGDTPPVLLALAATVTIRSKQNSRSVAIDQFFTGYRKTVVTAGEFIESIDIPKLQSDEMLKVYKISKRFDDDISAVCLALWLKFDITIENGIENARVTAVRIGCGGMAAVPARAKHTEQVLLHRPFDDDAVADAQIALLQDFSPLDDVRASAAYRLAVTGNLLKRAQLELLSGEDIHVMASADDYHTFTGSAHA